jgi:deferrochelatase/peroxidase EfeB
MPDATFDFEDDPHGFKTPRFAHIRKMYPRTSLVIDRDWHRIIRRSVPFGPIYDPSSGDACGPHADRGLLMNCYMASIEQQFEFLMRGWANDPDFFEAGDGPDAVVGDMIQGVTLRQTLDRKNSFCLERFVHTSGAFYAFVPSLTVLETLAQD